MTKSASAPPIQGLESHAPPRNAALLASMVVLWGLSWPVMKILVAEVPPLWGGTLRFATAAACLFAYLGWRGELVLPRREDMLITLSIGGLQMALFTALSMVAVQYTGAGRAAMLAYTTPLWSVLTAWLIFGQRPLVMQVATLGVGLIGIALICFPTGIQWDDPMGVLGRALLLLAAIAWSIVILHVRRHNWTTRPIQLAPWQMLFATGLLSIAALALEGLTVRHQRPWHRIRFDR